MPGTVVTFYSYKGGVGRSFILANIAVLLARWGYRVLCVDWDLEAPGLHEYFRPMTPAPPAGGVVDLVSDFLAGKSRPADYATRLSSAGELDFLAAGREGADYVHQVQEIDWQVLYEMGFGEYLERCREQWISDYDYVLLDSRTVHGQQAEHPGRGRHRSASQCCARPDALRQGATDCSSGAVEVRHPRGV
jgi:MinD-like ATPase involved in chromosome partitioning or flagellar assembly